MNRTATIAQALTQPGPIISVRPDRIGDQQHIWWLADGRTITTGIGTLPARTTYRPGDRVVGHGWRGRRGAPASRERYGFRGFVLGGMGAGELFGLTDDGHLWYSSTSVLQPADQVKPWEACTCCPHPERYAARPVREVQGNLLDLIGAMA